MFLSSNSFFNIVRFRGRLVAALVDAGYPVHVAVPGIKGEWARSVGAIPVAIDVDRSGLNPFTDAALWLTYVRLFRRSKPGFFLGYTAKPNIYGCLAGRVTGVVCMPNVSGLGTAFMSDGLLPRFVALLYRLAFRRAPIVFFQNPDDRDLFIARKIIRPYQARLLPGSGVDLDHFAPAREAPPAGDIRFLFIGRLLGDKGVREFVEAARQVSKAHPGWRFQLLGDVDSNNRTGLPAEVVRQWVDQGLVEHLGHVDDVRPHIAASTAVVLPSYREGLPRSLLEAAAMAKPLIATDVPGNRELVAHGLNGLLCEVRNSKSLAEAIIEIGSMGVNERARMGQAGRDLVERDYGVEKILSIYLTALAQLAGEGRV